jgi:hypothetical protein
MTDLAASLKLSLFGEEHHHHKKHELNMQSKDTKNEDGVTKQ